MWNLAVETILLDRSVIYGMCGQSSTWPTVVGVNCLMSLSLDKGKKLVNFMM